MKNDTNVIIRKLSDAELVRRAQQGDSEAFADLYNANKTKVYSLCLRMTGNPAEAEDLAQTAFMQVFRKLGSFRGDSALSTWLYRVAVNTVLMHFRKKSLRQLSLDEPVNNAPDIQHHEIGQEDGRLSGAVDRIALSRALSDLSAGYRRIFVLHEVEGLEHHEIAQRLNCSVGTSKSQLHKAKAKLRELLKLGESARGASARRRDMAARSAPRMAKVLQIGNPAIAARVAAAA